MTILFYKIDNVFTKSYSDVCEKVISLNCPYEKCYAEYPYIDNIEDTVKITINDLIDRYNRKDVRFT